MKDSRDGSEKVNKAKRIRGGSRPSPLESAESYVAGSPGTGCPGDGSREAFSLAFKALLEWGEANKLIRQEAWFIQGTNRWVKATYPNRFGLAWGRRESATAREYLTRLILQNRYFADDIQLVALVCSNARLRVLISQPHIAGDPATCGEIQRWFESLGFICREADDRIAWYEPEENLLIADAHEGNVIRSQNGVLVPIDLNIIQPSGELLKWATGSQRAI